MNRALQNLIAASLFVLALAVSVLALGVVRIVTTTALSCDTARSNFLQRAGRERLAIGIWRKRGIPEIGTVWLGMATDDEQAAKACGT